MLRWVSAPFRTSIWAESGISIPASSKATTANATAISTSEKPLFCLIAWSSGRDDHDPVVGRRGRRRPMCEDQICRRGILSFEIIRDGPWAGLAVQRTTEKYKDRALVIQSPRNI